MKREWLLLLVIVGLLGTTAPAQDQIAAAARQEFDQRLRRLEKDLEDMKADNTALRQKIQLLTSAMEKTQTATEAALNKNPAAEDLSRLAEAIKEVDRKRVADNKQLLDEIKRIIATSPAPAPRPPDSNGKNGKSGGKAKSVDATPPADQTGVYHTVEKGQTLGEIIKAYNDDLKAKGKPGKITIKQVMDANKGLDDKRMMINQKIFIPIPQ